MNTKNSATHSKRKKPGIFDPSFPFSPRKLPFFYGYIIIVISILATIITAPGQTIGISVFTDYLIHSFNLSRVALSMAYMIGTIGSAFLIRRAGTLIDVLGSRLMSVFITLFLGCTLIALSHLDAFARLIARIFFLKNEYHIVLFLLLTLGFFALRFLAQGVLSLISRTLIMQWFDKLKGRVASVVGIFTTLAMAGSPIVFNWLILMVGWRDSYIILGAIIAGFCSILLWLFVRNTPEECGLQPDGSFHSKNGVVDAEITETQSWTFHEAKSTYTFWIFNIGLSLYAFLGTAFAFNVTSIFLNAGLSRHSAVTIFFPATLISIIVKIISGWFCDLEQHKNKLKYQLMIFFVGLIIFCLGIILLPYILWGRDFLIVGFGVSTGLFITLSAVCWPQFFGRKHLGSIMGANTSYGIFSSAMGPLSFALSLKLTNSYMSAIIFVLAIVIVFCMLAIKANSPAFKLLNCDKSKNEL